MKLHSDTLTVADVLTAARTAEAASQDIFVSEIRQEGSRSRQRGIVFYCASERGRKATNRDDGERTASSTAWGYLLAELFRRDPKAIMTYYKGVEDFKQQVRAYTPRGESLDFLNVLEPA